MCWEKKLYRSVSARFAELNFDGRDLAIAQTAHRSRFRRGRHVGLFVFGFEINLSWYSNLFYCFRRNVLWIFGTALIIFVFVFMRNFSVVPFEDCCVILRLCKLYFELYCFFFARRTKLQTELIIYELFLAV